MKSEAAALRTREIAVVALLSFGTFVLFVGFVQAFFG